MDNNISDMMKNFSDMIGNSTSSAGSNGMDNDTKSSTSSFDFSKISPDMLNNFASMFQKGGSNNKEKSNIDIETILKMKNVMEKMNQADDPRSNLLKSLKPYLKPSRKDKVDQYITLFNMSKVMEFFKESGGGKTK